MHLYNPPPQLFVKKFRHHVSHLDFLIKKMHRCIFHDKKKVDGIPGGGGGKARGGNRTRSNGRTKNGEKIIRQVGNLKPFT